MRSAKVPALLRALIRAAAAVTGVAGPGESGLEHAPGVA